MKTRLPIAVLLAGLFLVLLAPLPASGFFFRHHAGRRAWVTPVPFTNAPAASFAFPVTTFRAYNLNGPDVTVAPDLFKSSTNADFAFSNATLVANTFTGWNPTPVGNVANLLTTGATFTGSGSMSMLSCPPGTYLISVGVGDFVQADTFALSIGGSLQTSNFVIGAVQPPAPAAPMWAELGPFQVTLASTQDIVIRPTASPAQFFYLKSWKRLANTPPNGSLSTPTNSQTFTAPASISITAAANDPDGQVVLAEYFNGGTFIGSATSAPWTFNWSGVLAGSYTINARFTDDRGGVTTVAGPSVTVNLPANSAPTVTLTAPTNGTSLGATLQSDGATLLPPVVTLSSTPADSDGTINRVDYYAGSTVIGTVTSAPWSATWLPPLGTFAIRAVATDNVGAQTISSAATLTVTNVVVSTPTNQPPIVSLVAPANNSTFTAPATVVLTALATDSDGAIASVKFYQGGTLLGTDTASPFTWTNTALAAGSYVFSAVAQDDKGTNATSATITVNVVSPTPPMTVNAGQDATITLPAVATLAGTVTGGATPLWSTISGPAAVSYGNTALTNSTATFSVAGTYTLRLTGTSGSTTLFDDVLLTVLPATPSTTAAKIQLPIEVVGDGGTVQSRTINLAGISGSSAYTLNMTAHNLSTYYGKGSFKLGNGPWVTISDTSVSVREPAKSFGGLFGAFYSVNFDYPIPVGTLQTGDNLLQVRLNYSVTNSQLNTSLSGLRILDLQIYSNTVALIASTNFVQEDVTAWGPVYTNETAYAKGKALWTSAPLTDTGVAITATCADCHAVDGYDLKYYCYSNPSIIARSRFHGLSQLEGEQIASYIRSLPGAAPGRPWNPPFQPGPGLDALPANYWSAGAGLSAVATNDALTFAAVWPSAPTYTTVTNSLNIRQTPVIYQFPDWNHWLPVVHPKDAWGSSTFTGSAWFTRYQQLTAAAAAVKAGGYTSSALAALRYNFEQMWADRNTFLATRYDGPTPYTSDYGVKMYSSGLWSVVKVWEVMQAYGLEGKQLSSQSREARTWFDSFAFDASPNLLKIPYDKTGIANNTPLMKMYFSSVWYQLALTLNPANYADGSIRSDTRPVDYRYSYGFITDTYVGTGYSAPATPASLFALYLLKAMQVMDLPTTNGINSASGWYPTAGADVSMLVNPSKQFFWYTSTVSGANRTALFENMLIYWLNRCQRFTPAQYYAAGFQGASYVIPASPQWDGTTANLADKVWLMIPAFRTAGVSEPTLTSVKNWAATLWAANNWSSR